MTVAAVMLWGARIAAVSIDAPARYATFQYDPAFVRSGIQIAPIRMPLRTQPYSFPGLPQDAFSGLPGLLADSLPDRWGTALINAWLASQGRDESSFDVVQRLCYVGTRGVGALEFEPAREPSLPPGADIQVDALVRLASEVLAEREQFVTELSEHPDEEAMKDPRGWQLCRWRPPEGVHRLQRRHRAGPLRAGSGRRRLQILAVEVRRRVALWRPRAH